MVIDGGQVGIALGYAFFPWVIGTFYKAIESNKVFYGLLSAFLVAVTGFADLRLAYLSFLVIIMVSVYFLLINSNRKAVILGLFKNYFILVMIFLGIHSYWLFPLCN